MGFTLADWQFFRDAFDRQRTAQQELYDAFNQLRTYLVDTLEETKEIIMAKFNDVETKVSALESAVTSMRTRITSDVTALQTEIQTLKDQIASGGFVSGEQLDALDSKLTTLLTVVNSVDPVPGN